MTSFPAKEAGTLVEDNMKRIGIGWVTFEGKQIEYPGQATRRQGCDCSSQFAWPWFGPRSGVSASANIESSHAVSTTAMLPFQLSSRRRDATTPPAAPPTIFRPCAIL